MKRVGLLVTSALALLVTMGAAQSLFGRGQTAPSRSWKTTRRVFEPVKPGAKSACIHTTHRRLRDRRAAACATPRDGAATESELTVLEMSEPIRMGEHIGNTTMRLVSSNEGKDASRGFERPAMNRVRF